MACVGGQAELTLQEKTFLASCAIAYDSATRAMREYEAKYQKPPPGRTTVQYWKNQLWEDGSLKARSKSGRPSDETTKTAVVRYFTENQENVSQRKAAEEIGTSPATVNRILKKEGIRPWKYQMVHDIHGDDPDRRLQFCEWIVNQRSPDFYSRRIIFSDESNFYLNGCVNRHNLFYYSATNQHLTLTHRMTSPSVTVWAAVSFDKGIVFQTMINQTMNGERYRETLENHLSPFIEQHHIFQHDGAPAHFSCVAREWLDANLQGRWIGRRGFQEWPPRSPDLTICDFWLWSYVKDQVFRRDHQSLQDLARDIEDCLANIPQRMIQRCYHEFVKRCNLCFEVEGNVFEHLL